MQNFLFRYEGHEYVTLFGINYLNKKVEDTLKLPDGVINAVRKTYTASAELSDISVTTNMQGQCVATATVKIHDKLYHLDTDNEVNPLREITPKVPPVPAEAEAPTEEVLVEEVGEVPDDVIEHALIQGTPINVHPNTESAMELAERITSSMAASEPPVKRPTKEELNKAFVEENAKRLETLGDGSSQKNGPLERDILTAPLKQESSALKEEVVEKSTPVEVYKELETSGVVQTQKDGPSQRTLEASLINQESSTSEEETPKYNPIYLKRIDAYSLSPISLDEVAQKGDAYCEMNKWARVDQLYMIDDVVSVMRYVHSDALNVNLAIPYEEVANYGKD